MYNRGLLYQYAEILSDGFSFYIYVTFMIKTWYLTIIVHVLLILDKKKK